VTTQKNFKFDQYTMPDLGGTVVYVLYSWVFMSSSWCRQQVYFEGMYLAGRTHRLLRGSGSM